MRPNVPILGVALLLSRVRGLENSTQHHGRDGSNDNNQAIIFSNFLLNFSEMYSLFSIVQFPNEVIINHN